MEELIKLLGIDKEGYYSDYNYIIDIDNSDEFNKIFGKLDENNEIKENPDISVIDPKISNITYYSKNHILNLIANYSSDKYKLVISPKDGYEEEEEE